MTPESLKRIATIGIATITTTDGSREPICIALRGARNDQIYIRPSSPLTPAQRDEAIAQGCAPETLASATPLELVPDSIVENLDGVILIASEAYEDIALAWDIRNAMPVRFTWSTLHPLEQVPGVSASASSAAESILEQIRAFYKVAPTFENRIPHVIDTFYQNDELIGFSIAGPLVKKLVAPLGIVEPSGRLDALTKVEGVKEAALAFATDQILPLLLWPRIKAEFARPDVRDAINKVLRDTAPEGRKVALLEDYEADHPLNPSNPDNQIKDFDPADYPLQ